MQTEGDKRMARTLCSALGCWEVASVACFRSWSACCRKSCSCACACCFAALARAAAACSHSTLRQSADNQALSAFLPQLALLQLHLLLLTPLASAAAARMV